MTNEPNQQTDLLRERLEVRGAALTPAARRVIQFIDRNRAQTLASSAIEIATRTRTSDATVIRAVQALGFAGLGELKQTLVSSVSRPATPADDMRRTLEEVGESSATATRMVLETHAESLAALMNPASQTRIVSAAAQLNAAERIVVFGIGPSAALASYATMLLERSGRRSKSLIVSGLMLADQMLDLRSGDALLVLAYGRSYREVTTVFSEARRLGLKVVLVTDTMDHRFARVADMVVPVSRGRAERVGLASEKWRTIFDQATCLS